MFVTIFPWGCKEFLEFSMFREIPEYSRFVAAVRVQVDSTNRSTRRHHSNSFHAMHSACVDVPGW